MIDETAYGEAWRSLARSEGHMRRFPNHTTATRPEPHYMPKLRTLIAKGMTHKEVAAELGIVRSRVTQVLRDFAA